MGLAHARSNIYIIGRAGTSPPSLTRVRRVCVFIGASATVVSYSGSLSIIYVRRAPVYKLCTSYWFCKRITGHLVKFQFLGYTSLTFSTARTRVVVDQETASPSVQRYVETPYSSYVRAVSIDYHSRTDCFTPLWARAAAGYRTQVRRFTPMMSVHPGYTVDALFFVSPFAKFKISCLHVHLVSLWRCLKKKPLPEAEQTGIGE